MLIGYVVQTCCYSECGISFAVPKVWNDKKLEDCTRFYCPNGHGQSYKAGNTEEERLRRENQRLIQKRAELEDDIRDRDAIIEHEQKRTTAFKGHITRIKNRVAAGVCPCCNRTFQDLARHMETKHSGYKKEAVSA